MSEIHLPQVPGKAPPPERTFLHRAQAALALVIALAAIALAAWEGIENRRHNRLTVKPRLAGEIEAGREGADQFVRMAIEGTGLGPAVIGTFRIYFDGVPQDSTVASASNPWQNVVNAVSDTTTRVHARTLGDGYYFPAGRHYVLFEARRPVASADSAAGTLADILERVAVQVCYCSVYGTDCDEVLLTAARMEARECRR
jgi:hypothetical protein